MLPWTSLPISPIESMKLVFCNVCQEVGLLGQWSCICLFPPKKLPYRIITVEHLLALHLSFICPEQYAVLPSSEFFLIRQFWKWYLLHWTFPFVVPTQVLLFWNCLIFLPVGFPFIFLFIFKRFSVSVCLVYSGHWSFCVSVFVNVFCWSSIASFDFERCLLLTTNY